MKFNKQKYLFLGFLALFIFGSLLTGVGCTKQDVSKEKHEKVKETITFADSGWDSLSLNNEVAGFIIRNGFGYKTDIIPGSTTATLTGVANGDIDVRMENWKDTYGDEYFKPLENGDFIEVSVNFDDNIQGFYVPTFLIKGDPERGIKPLAPDLKKLADLPKYWELFKDPEDKSKGRIYGGPTTWSTEQILPVKVEYFGLSDTYNYFRPGSDIALAVAIASAVEKGKPIVAYYWEPTWLMGKYDMTLLEEPEYSKEKWENGYQCAFPAIDVTIIVNKELPEEAPEVVEFLSNYKTNSKLINEALAYMQDNNAEASEAAIWFLKKNEDIWTKWVSEDVAKKVKAALE